MNTSSSASSVDIGRDEDRQEQRHCNVGDLDPLDGKSENENDEHREPDCASGAARHEGKEVLHQPLTLHPAKRQREHLRADQDEHHHVVA
jgi:hypothetical protein